MDGSGLHRKSLVRFITCRFSLTQGSKKKEKNYIYILRLGGGAGPIARMFVAPRVFAVRVWATRERSL